MDTLVTVIAQGVLVALYLATLVACWWLTFFGLPGNWLIVGLAAAAAWLAPESSPLAISTTAVYVLAGLATVGEVIEFAAGSVGARRAGASRRSALLSIVGALVGGVAGAIVGLPIPVIGSLAAAVLFASAGAMAGAMLGESAEGRSLDHSWQVGQAAFWGRFLGTLGKTAVGCVMLVVAALALCF